MTVVPLECIAAQAHCDDLKARLAAVTEERDGLRAQLERGQLARQGMGAIRVHLANWVNGAVKPRKTVERILEAHTYWSPDLSPPIDFSA